MTDTVANFVHLHTHTEFSMLDGMGQVTRVCAAAAEDNQPAIAMTDHGSLAGAWRFNKAAKEAGLKPILGLEAYLALGDRFENNEIEVDRDDMDYGDDNPEANAKSDTKTKRYEHLTILATNKTGWNNLVTMQNKAQDSFWYYPRIDYSLLKEHSEGLIVLTGCLAGPVAGPVMRGNVDEARDNIRTLIDCVGKENVYVEIMEHGIDVERRGIETLVGLSKEFDLPLVATNDAHFVGKDDCESHDAWLAVGTKKHVGDKKRFKFNGSGYHLRTEDEMRTLRTEDWWDDACSETVKIAERCADIVLETPGLQLPVYTPPAEFETSRAYFKHLVMEGAKEIYGVDDGKLPIEVRERLNMEFKIIASMGFIDYFLIVWDLISWAKSDRALPSEEFPNGEQGGKKPIVVGPGRGSAAGSLISYCLNIVDLDPLENDLLFERFLEPGRLEMPDIDLDFESLRRNEILAYLSIRWGNKNVSRIGSFSMSLSKRALKDSARVHERTDIGADLTKLILLKGNTPLPFKSMFDTANRNAKDFQDAVSRGGPDLENVMRDARAFEGVVNGQSTHACGVLIAPMSLPGVIPIRYDRKKDGSNAMITSWDAKDVEAYGLLKLDILGLENLDIISAALKSIERSTGEVVTLADIPHPSTQNDPRVEKMWELLCAGNTGGVFQLDSAGITRLTEEVQPRTFKDLTAIISLFRPGPLSAKMHTRYVERKHGREEVDYTIFTDDKAEQEAIAVVLDETFGVYVYQEQIMRLGTVMAGFDVVGRSKLRKAVGKKDLELMNVMGEAFIEGCMSEQFDDSGELISMRFSEQTALNMWDAMKGSAEYLFNKSHAAAYAKLSYYTAYLKANWPVDYGAAILAITSHDDKRYVALRTLVDAGIDVFPPDVNVSYPWTAPELDPETHKPTGNVRLGLSEIKGVGVSGKHIYNEREARGAFVSLHDLMSRVKAPGDTKDDGTVEPEKKLNLTAVEGLINAGACDQFGSRLGLIRVSRASSEVDYVVPNCEWPSVFRSMLQRERLGIAVGEHPLVAEKEFLTKWRTPQTRHENTGSKPTGLHKLTKGGVLTMGVIASWGEFTGARGRFARFTLEGSKNRIDGQMWTESLTEMMESNGVPSIGDIVVVSGYVKTRVIQNIVDSSDGDDVEASVSDEIEVKELSANKMWIVKVPHKIDSMPVNLFKGKTPTVTPTNSGHILASLSASAGLAFSTTQTPADDAHTPQTANLSVTQGVLDHKVEDGGQEIAESDENRPDSSDLEPFTDTELASQPKTKEISDNDFDEVDDIDAFVSTPTNVDDEQAATVERDKPTTDVDESGSKTSIVTEVAAVEEAKASGHDSEKATADVPESETVLRKKFPKTVFLVAIRGEHVKSAVESQTAGMLPDTEMFSKSQAPDELMLGKSKNSVWQKICGKQNVYVVYMDRGKNGSKENAVAAIRDGLNPITLLDTDWVEDGEGWKVATFNAEKFTNRVEKTLSVSV